MQISNVDELANDICILADYSAESTTSRVFRKRGNMATLRVRILIHLCMLGFQFQ
jgi:hypothetical protein